MIVFAPAKINLGLHVLFKRPDGFHEIGTCMKEIPFFDILEITTSDDFEFLQTGLSIDSPVDANLCTRAFDLIRKEYNIPNVRIHLRKQIPMGAGLGGGSSDAVCVLMALVDLFELQVSKDKLLILSAILGSDCPFFVDGGSQIAKGRGELLKAIHIDLDSYYLVLLNPGIHIGTKETYAAISYSDPLKGIDGVLSQPVSTWKNDLINDFEGIVFELHPSIEEIKKRLYDLGAIYASMSGSGSSVFGLFERSVSLPKELQNYLVYSGSL